MSSKQLFDSHYYSISINSAKKTTIRIGDLKTPKARDLQQKNYSPLSFEIFHDNKELIILPFVVPEHLFHSPEVSKGIIGSQSLSLSLWIRPVSTTFIRNQSLRFRCDLDHGHACHRQVMASSFPS